MTGPNYIELYDLQNEIGENIGLIRQWVKVEIEKHSIARGHHYFDLIQKDPSGGLLAKARGTIWASRSDIIGKFSIESGSSLESGMEIVILCTVEFHPVYGISLNIEDIDASFTTGQRELERRATIEQLESEGMMDKQKELERPFLPGKIALVTSETAAGYGDFTRHIETNEYGYRYDFTLFASVMQGDSSPISICNSLKKIQEQGCFSAVFIFRGGGADSDMYCFDDYGLSKAIATFPLPVFTAIGHERDYHVADMVAHEHFKTPTALADALIGWTAAAESELLQAAEGVSEAAMDRISLAEEEIRRAVGNIRFALGAAIKNKENEIALAEARIQAANPRGILQQGYVLAVGKDGKLYKKASDARKGDEFTLRFLDGRWECTINNTL